MKVKVTLIVFMLLTFGMGYSQDQNGDSKEKEKKTLTRSSLDLSKNPDQGSPLKTTRGTTAFLKSFEEDQQVGLLYGYEYVRKKPNRNKANLFNLTFKLSGPISEDKSEPQTLIDFDGLTGTTSLDVGFSYKSGQELVTDTFYSQIFVEADRVIKELSAELKKAESRGKTLQGVQGTIAKVRKKIAALEDAIGKLSQAAALDKITLADFPTEISINGRLVNIRQDVKQDVEKREPKLAKLDAAALNTKLKPHAKTEIQKMVAELSKNRTSEQKITEASDKLARLLKQEEALNKAFEKLSVALALGNVSPNDFPLKYRADLNISKDDFSTLSTQELHEKLAEPAKNTIQAISQELADLDLQKKPLHRTLGTPAGLPKKKSDAENRIAELKAAIKKLSEARAMEIMTLEDFPESIFIGDKEKNYQKEYLAAHSNKRKVIGFNYQLGYKSFDFVLPENVVAIPTNQQADPTENPITVTSSSRQADKITAYVGIMAGKSKLLESNTYIGLNYLRQSFYKGQASGDICVDQVDPDGNPINGVSFCSEHAIGAPTKTEVDQLQFEFRKLIRSVGINIRLTYDFDKSDWALSAPVYFISQKNAALPNAGLAFHFNNDNNEAGFSFFIDQPFKIFKN